jgi:Tripartite tricarboxylate transporter family receptor
MLRGLPILVFSLVAALASGPVLSQAYPARPIKLIVPFPPGGVVDFVGRLLAQEMSKGLGQPVLVENRPGGGSTIGIGLVAKAPPDGYLIVLGGTSGLAINVALMKLPYDPVKDLASISLVGTLPYVAVAYPGAGIESVGDLIAKAKARPGAIAFGSSGNGTPLHLAGELFKTMTGTNLVHVPYKGSGPALTALIAGEIPVAFVDLTAALPAHPQRQGAGTGYHGFATAGRRLGLADDGRGGVGGLRAHRLDRSHRAGGNAPSDRPAAECRGESRDEPARGARKAAGSRLRADGLHTRTLLGAHRCRNPAMGAPGSGVRNEAGLSLEPWNCFAWIGSGIDLRTSALDRTAKSANVCFSRARPAATGRVREFATFGCSRSAAILSRSSVGTSE